MAAARAALKLRPANAQEEAPHGVKGKVPRPAAASSKMASGQENQPAVGIVPPQRGASAAAGRKGRAKAVEEAATGEATRKAEAADAAPAEGKRLAELPSDSDEVLFVLAKDGSIDPDDEEASLKAYAKAWAEKNGQTTRPVVALPPWTPKTRLPKEEVDLILSLQPACFKPYDEETLRRDFPSEPVEDTMEIMREAAEAAEVVAQDVIDYQNWIRGELEDKDYVEVPNKFLQDREEFIEWAQEEVDQMLKSVNIPDRYFASDSDDEVEEVALES